MKRTPLWVFVAAVGVQLAALGLCLLAMEWNVRAHEEEEAPEGPAPAPEPEQAPPPRALAPAPAPSAADIAFAYAALALTPEPVAVPRPDPERPAAEALRTVQVPEPFDAQAAPSPSFVVHAAESPAAPRFGPPPVHVPDIADAPRFIAEAADAGTQVVRGRAGEGSLAFGFYPDGNIRFVDADGGRYAGKAESARARMREIDGMRAFTVQIGVGVDQRLQATFTGGAHDAETIALEPLAGWSVA